MSFGGFFHGLRDLFKAEILHRRDESPFGTGPRSEFLAGLCDWLEREEKEIGKERLKEVYDERLRINPPAKPAPML